MLTNYFHLGPILLTSLRWIKWCVWLKWILQHTKKILYFSKFRSPQLSTLVQVQARSEIPILQHSHTHGHYFWHKLQPQCTWNEDLQIKKLQSGKIVVQSVSGRSLWWVFISPLRMKWLTISMVWALKRSCINEYKEHTIYLFINVIQDISHK